MPAKARCGLAAHTRQHAGSPTQRRRCHGAAGWSTRHTQSTPPDHSRRSGAGVFRGSRGGANGVPYAASIDAPSGKKHTSARAAGRAARRRRRRPRRERQRRRRRRRAGRAGRAAAAAAARSGAEEFLGAQRLHHPARAAEEPVEARDVGGEEGGVAAAAARIAARRPTHVVGHLARAALLLDLLRLHARVDIVLARLRQLHLRRAPLLPQVQLVLGERRRVVQHGVHLRQLRAHALQRDEPRALELLQLALLLRRRCDEVKFRRRLLRRRRGDGGRRQFRVTTPPRRPP